MPRIDTGTRNRIRDLNDAFRKGEQPDLGRIVITSGVRDLVAAWPLGELGLYEAVRRFDDFNEDNDPHGEHDFGAFEHAGERCFWKLDYYDSSLEYGSEDPADPAKTTRVLTIMLAEEY
jgi:hypothetical protein